MALRKLFPDNLKDKKGNLGKDATKGDNEMNICGMEDEIKKILEMNSKQEIPKMLSEIILKKPPKEYYGN